MTAIASPGATVPGVTHHLIDLNGTQLHYVSSGRSGTPIVLLHGWPETWWAFRKLIPLLSETHRVYALDLRGFGDSGNADIEYGEKVMTEDVHLLLQHLGCGPAHLLCQDISGGIGFRLASTYPEDLLSLIAVETTLTGFGLEQFGDVSAGASWHVGFLAAPGIPEMLLPGHERELLADFAYPMMTGTDHVYTDADIDEFTRSYARPHAWRGTTALYQGIYTDQEATRARARAHPVTVPVLAVDAVSHPFTETTFRAVAAGQVAAVHLEGVGHLIAQEAPERLAAEILAFAAPDTAG